MTRPREDPSSAHEKAIIEIIDEHDPSPEVRAEVLGVLLPSSGGNSFTAHIQMLKKYARAYEGRQQLRKHAEAVLQAAEKLDRAAWLTMRSEKRDAVQGALATLGAALDGIWPSDPTKRPVVRLPRVRTSKTILARGLGWSWLLLTGKPPPVRDDYPEHHRFRRLAEAVTRAHGLGTWSARTMATLARSGADAARRRGK